MPDEHAGPPFTRSSFRADTVINGLSGRRPSTATAEAHEQGIGACHLPQATGQGDRAASGFAEH